MIEERRAVKEVLVLIVEDVANKAFDSCFEAPSTSCEVHLVFKILTHTMHSPLRARKARQRDKGCQMLLAKGADKAIVRPWDQSIAEGWYMRKTKRRPVSETNSQASFASRVQSCGVRAALLSCQLFQETRLTSMSSRNGGDRGSELSGGYTYALPALPSHISLDTSCSVNAYFSTPPSLFVQLCAEQPVPCTMACCANTDRSIILLLIDQRSMAIIQR